MQEFPVHHPITMSFCAMELSSVCSLLQLLQHGVFSFCITNIGEVGRLQKEFQQRGVRPIALSLNDVEAHKR